MGWFSDLFETKQETSSTATPYGPAAPGIASASQLVSGALNTPLEYFPGQSYVPRLGAEQLAATNLREGALAYPGMLEQFMTPGAAGWQGAMGAPQAALGMGLQDVMNNPALTGAADAIQGRVNRNLQENVLPGLTEQFMGYGGTGGTRQGVAEGLAAGRTSDVLSEQLANMYGNAWAQGLGAETSRYNAGLGAQSSAISQMPGMVNLAQSEWTQPAAMHAQRGAMNRVDAERALADEMARFEFSQTEPYQRANMGLGILMGPGQAFGTRQETATSQPSAWSRLGQMASLGSSLFGAGFGGAPGSSGFSDFIGGGLGGGYMPPPMQFGQYNNPWSYGGYGGY